MAKKKAYSDRYLSSKFRNAVLIRDNYTCQICNIKGLPRELEAHHYVHRKVKLLRYDSNNGFTVHKHNCHILADKLDGREKLKKVMGPDRYEYIKEMELKDFKNYLLQQRLSNNEWLKLCYADLMKVIKDYED